MTPQLGPGSLILFTRLPRLGRGKRRLARAEGIVAAYRFQFGVLVAALDRLRGSAPCCRLVVTPWRERLNPRLRRAARGWRVVAQGSGDLGTRMARALRAAPPGPAVLVGSDIPTLSRHHVTAGLRALSRADYVIGPSADGGFWMVGGREAARPPFRRDIRWSTAKARADTLRGFAAHRSVGWLELLEDVDDGPSYHRWLEREALSDSVRRGISSTKLQGRCRLSS